MKHHVAFAAVAAGLLLCSCAQTASVPAAVASASPAPAPAPATSDNTPQPANADEAKAVSDNEIAIDFATGSATLTDAAIRKLDLAARLYRDASPVLMFTTGHSDNTGDEYANLILSARRAKAVKEALVARGIPADKLLLQAMGTSEPLKGPEADNRSVVVTWHLT